MSKSTICFVAVVALAMPWPDGFEPPAPLVDLHGLTDRQVKSAAFRLDEPQELRIEAVGSEWEDGSPNAWIIDLRSRTTVWELGDAHTSSRSGGTGAFDSTITLPAGSYQAFYSAHAPVGYRPDKDKSEKKGLFGRFWSRIVDEMDASKLVIYGDGHLMTADEVSQANDDLRRGAIVAFHATSPEQLQQSGFALDRPTRLDIYAVGEAREDGEYDSGWIVNVDTHERIWKLTWKDSAPAGGADKNRSARFTTTLPAGRYAAFYATDDSHDPSSWNAAPPHDPDAWGLFIRAPDAAARAGVTTFAYEHVPESSTFVALTHAGDDETMSRSFTLARPIDVRIYALGEGRDGHMYDYGWITAAGSHRRIWDMRYEDTEPAGGASKNRLVDRVVHFDKGDYTVYYVTDGSHSARAWNAAAPIDGQHWGITLLAARGPEDRAAASICPEKQDPSVIAQLVRVRDDEQRRTAFTLTQDGDVRVYALGEGVGGEMADYGWIEDAKTRRTVWRMTYRATESAGGAVKNRRVDETVRLPAGEYVLHYETDGSHAFGEWNDDPPDDPLAWGITVSRVDR